jgi:LCP family protein required for cell wall assembly
MENFRRPKRPKKGVTIDGIFSEKRRNSVHSNAKSGSVANFHRSQSYQPPQNQSVGNFRQPSGFNAASQPSLSSGTNTVAPMTTAPSRARATEPLAFETPKKPKKFLGIFPRKAKTDIQPKSRKKKIIKRTLIVLAVIALFAGGYFAYKVYITQRHVLKGGGKAPALANQVDISQLKGEGDGRINVLLLGIGGPGHDGPDLTDTIMLASIDPINNEAALVSIPRDLWVKIPNNGTQKINAAYAYGKQQSKAKDAAGKQKDALDLVDKTVGNVIGIPIHYHVVVDFAAFKQAVDAVGGVTLNVPEQLYDPTIAWENNWNSVIAKPGVQTFNGSKALLYARSRETSTDFARGQRQRALLVALKDKVTSAGTFTNPVKISDLLSSFGNNVYTDFSLNDIMRLKEIGSKIPSSSISSLDMVTPPHDLLTTGMINGLSTVYPKAGVGNYTALQDYIRNALRDGYLKKENANVAVLNGTPTGGLATKQATILKSYGYNVTQVADAPTKNYANTIIVDLRNGTKKYTRHYLENRFNTKATSKLPDGIDPGTADFVIILGQNETSN